MGESSFDDDVTVVVSETAAERVARGRGEPSFGAGEHVGRYRLIERLGAGGMGVVWAAEDPRLGRTVALKVLHERAARGRSRAQERMRREAMAQARLSHPNVVPIYDVGVHEGRLFLAMEYVEGRTLAEWSAESPELPAILEIFEQAAAGLAAVHGAGFVHRDFKPSNVMIDREGRVLVMDFGLARLSDPESSTSELEPSLSSSSLSLEGSQLFSTVLTCDGVIMGTPAYMAPEQHVGAGADARADQFAFCAALLEVLLGRRPFDGRTIKELARDKIHGARDFSDARVSVSRGLRALVRRGLDPEPARRHPDMEALRGGLAALRRRRSSVRPLALATVGLLVAGGIGWASLVRADSHACEAGARRMATVWNDEARDRLRSSFASTGVGYADDAARRTTEGLDRYAEHWVGAHRGICLDAAEPVEARAEVDALDLRMACLAHARASMTVTVELLLDADEGSIHRASAQVAGLPSLERCGDLEALRAEALLPDEPSALAAVEQVRAEVEAARMLELAGRYDEGLAKAEAALARARSLEHEPTIARALVRMGALSSAKGDPEGARARLVEAALLAAGAGDHPTATDAASRLVFVCAEDLGLPEEAMRWARHAEASLGRMPADPLARARLDTSLGVLHSTMGEYAPALERFEASFETKREVLGEQHPEVAGALENVALAHGELGRPRDAVELHRRTVTIMEQALGSEHPDYAHSLMNLGFAVGTLGRHDEAVEHYTHALAISRAALGADHPQVAGALSSLGHAAIEQDRLLEAERHYKDAAGILERTLGERSPDHAWLLSDRAYVVSLLGRDDEALELYRRARSILEASHGPEHDGVAHVLMSEATSLIELRRTDEAEAVLDRVGEIFETKLEPEHPSRGAYLANRGELRRAQGDLPRARTKLLEGLEITRGSLGAEHPAVAAIYLSLGEIEHELHRPDAAEDYLRQALRITETGSVGEGFRSAIRFALAKVLWGSPAFRAEARALAERAHEGFVGYGDVFDEDVTEIDGWLRTHRR